MHTRATSRTNLHACSGSGKPNADYSPLRKSKSTHTHAFIHACIHACMYACMHAYMHKCLHCMDRYNDIYIMYRRLFMPVQNFEQPSAATASGPQSIGGGEGIKIGDEMKIDNLCRPEGQIIVRLSCLACLACPSVGARAQPGQWRTHMQCTSVCMHVCACTGTICLSVPHSHSTP